VNQVETARHANLRAYGESGEVCAVCELTAVCIDPKTRKPRTFPPEIAAKAKEIL
jgi:acyl-CoA thioesterase FadM